MCSKKLNRSFHLPYFTPSSEETYEYRFITPILQIRKLRLRGLSDLPKDAQQANGSADISTLVSPSLNTPNHFLKLDKN